LLSWFKNRRRRELIEAPFPDDWLRIVQRNVRFYSRLPSERRSSLHDKIKVFVAEKRWEGCGGLELTDEIKVTIAAQACVLLIGLPDGYYFDGVRTILVYPDAYEMPAQRQQGQLIVQEGVALAGEAWHRGPIVLGWRPALEGARYPGRGQNLVIHEFAHHVDGLNGEMDGMPPLPSIGDNRRWEEVTEQEYQRLVDSAVAGRATLLDKYGASNRAEFFAVASECFFSRPRALRQHHPDLYDILRGLYQQDPAEWIEEEGGPTP
jgi:Mlc titration factor MtfA (ptsG expression regulator)